MSSRRRHARSPAVRTPLDDDDLLSEILLRLPPQPSSLPRASLVCKRWRRLVSDRGFFRRFRLHHRRNPPILGVFDKYSDLSFLPTLEAPDRVPPERFSLQHDDEDGLIVMSFVGVFDKYSVLSFLPTLEAPDRVPPERFSLQHDNEDGLIVMSFGCRHGLFLIFLQERHQVLVWDPVTGDQHRVAIPAALDRENDSVNGAVLRDAGDDQHFQVVLIVVGVDEEQHEQALACVYSSKTGLWGNLTSTPLPYEANGTGIPTSIYPDDAVLVGDSLYWKLAENLVGILEFDLERQSLAVIRVPVDMYDGCDYLKVMRAEDGGLGFLFVSGSDCTAQFWKRTTDCDGVASWGLARTIELDKLLSLKPEEKGVAIQGFAEENNVVFLWTMIGFFMIHLESLKFNKLFETMTLSYYHPFESVYAAGARFGGGHNVAKLLLST